MLVFGAFSLLLVLFSLIAHHREKAEIIAEYHQDVSFRMAWIQRAVQSEIDDGKWESVLQTIANAALYGDIKYIALLNDKNKVLYSTRFAWKDQFAENVLDGFSSVDNAEAQRKKVPVVRDDPVGQVLYSHYPIALPNPSGLRDNKMGTLVMAYDLTPGFEQLNHQMRANFLDQWLVTFGLSLLLVLLLNRNLSRPIRRLSAAVEQVQQGNYGIQVKVRQKSEIGRLSQAFNAMSLQLKTTLNALDKAEQHERLILASTAEGIYGMNLEGECTFANTACLKMLGYESQEELVGYPMHERMHHHFEDLTYYPESDCPIYRDCLSGRTVHCDSEVFWRKDGSSFRVEYHAHPIVENDEIIGAVVTFHDISERIRMEEAEKEALRMLQTILDRAPALISTKDLDGNVTFANRYFEILDARGPDAFQGKNIYDLFPEEVADELWKNDLVAQKADEGVELEEVVKHSDGTEHTYLTIKFPLKTKEGELFGTCAISTDITERNQREKMIRLLSQALEQTPLSVFITDKDGVIQYVNPHYVEVSGYSAQQLIGQKPSFNQSGATNRQVYQDLWDTILSGQTWTGEILNKRASGATYWENVIISPLEDDKGQLQNFICIKEDISHRKRYESQILHQAHYDPLTDLPNRMLASDRLNQAIKAAERHQKKVAVIFVDLDNFKKINDSLGHEAGDQLLIEATKRLQKCVRAEDTLARQGGDEFLIVLADMESSDEVERVALGISEQFSKPFTLSGITSLVTASMGVALYPDDGRDSAMLIRNADAAMYRAKDEGRNNFQFFAPQMNEHALRRLQIEQHLHGVLERNELEIYYQPLINAKTARIVGAEALIRWTNADLGRVSPAEFIPICEQTGLIIDIGDWIIQTACQQAQDWIQLGLTDFYISINVSPRQFRGRNVLHSIERALKATGLQAKHLEIEVTEGLLVRNHPDTLEVMSTLKSQGVLIAMDDFGTGYSSLSYLRNFPFSTLKIDQSFVRDVVSDKEDRELVQATIAMARSLGLKIVGEGVEEKEQYEYLRDQQCDIVQGYYFSPPIQASAFLELLTKNNCLP